MKITITIEDVLKAGKAKVFGERPAFSCPVVQTLIRLGYKDVMVGLRKAWTTEQSWNLSNPLQLAIREYDAGNDFQLGTYTLNPVSDTEIEKTIKKSKNLIQTSIKNT